MAAPRRRNSYASRVAQNTQAQLQAKLSTFAARLARDWAALTWRADTTKIGPLAISMWNWIIVAGLAAAAHILPGQRLIIAGIAGVWLLATLIRAGYVMPRRRTALQAMYEQLRDRAGLPAGTATRPANPEQSLTAVKWGAGQSPARFTLTIGGKCPAASSTILRPILEADIEDQIISPLHPNGDWMFTWPAKNTVTCTAVPADTPDLLKKTIERRIIGALRAPSAFNITSATAIADSYALTIDDWSDETRGDGETVPFPIAMTFHTGHRDLTDPGIRDTIERAFDRSVSCPGEWIYTWNIDSGQLVIRRVAKSSLDASRKLNERKFSDDVRSAVTRPGKDPIVADVTVWADEESDQPQELTVNFGTLPLGERAIRDRFEDSLDSSVQSRWPDVRLLFDWQFLGGTTSLGITAVDHTDERALRKAVEKKLRNVVESKFGKAKSPVDCDILEWQDKRAANGAALPQVARVNFGAVDVTKSETRDYFQMHWDSLSTENDWHYAWNTAEGIVTMTAVPPLPEQLAFPAPETPEFDEAMRLARKGILRFGPQKGGGSLDWNLNETPHGLIGGKTGSGKAIECSTTLITPDGWRELGDLEVGDLVFDENGKPTQVTGVFDQPLADTCFEVVFSDGTSVVADDQHLWWTEDRVTRVARTQQRHYDGARARRSWLTETVCDRLRAAASTARPHETITLPEAADLAGLSENEMGPLRVLAESIGPAEEVRTEDRVYHYRRQVVFQRQTVKVFDGPELAEHLIAKARSPRASKNLREHSTGLMAALAELRDRGDGICAHDLATALGLSIKTVRNWLQTADTAVSWEKRERLVQLSVPEKTVVRQGPAVRLYPKAALLALAAERGESLLWDQRSKMKIGQVRTTNEIRHSLHEKSGQANHSIPVAKPLQFPDADLPIAPYTLGAWLGDGSSRDGRITSMDQGVVDRISEDGYEAVPGYQAPGNKARTYGIHGIHGELTRLGLRKRSTTDGPTKRIPDDYLRAGEEQRRALLAGLLDTDGTVAPQGAVQFDNTNEVLARGVLELARGLGYRATMTSRPAMLNGQQHGTVYRVSFTTRDKVFGLHRKQLAHHERAGSANVEKHSHRYIVDVRKVAPVPMRCISVDSPTRQFLIGESMIPTHNSVALSIVLFYALHNPDLFEIVVCDPKRTDFTWTPEFPSVVRFAATDTEIVAAVAYVKGEMDARQSLLNRLQVRKIGWLRDKYRQQPELEAENGPAPKRLILFFDEIADFLAKGANSDLEELKDEARADLESIGRLARAMECNIVAAAQKPDAKIISTQLRSQLGFRLGVGPLDQYESQQILNSDHGTRFPEAGTPKGRAWGYDPTNGYRQVQTMFLPDDPMVCPWDSTVELAGTKKLVRERLRELGYSEVTITNGDGGSEARWMPVELDDDDESAPAPAATDAPESTAAAEMSAAVSEPVTADDENPASESAPKLRLVPLVSPEPTALDQQASARLAAVAVGVNVVEDPDDPWA